MSLVRVIDLAVLLREYQNGLHFFKLQNKVLSLCMQILIHMNTWLLIIRYLFISKQ